MFGRIHQLLPVVLGFLGVSTAWADAGYLPEAGPMPLRFRVPAPPAAQHLPAPITPPPPAPIALPAPPMPSASPEASNTAPAKVIKPLAPTNGPALEFDAREPVTDTTPSIPADGVISPQMLMKYFTAPVVTFTNAASVGVVAPIGFNPPPVTTPVPTPIAPSKPKVSPSP